MRRKPIRIDNATNYAPLNSTIKDINKRFNSILLQGREDGKIIKHNLEYGIGAETVLRSLLRETLPIKYGIGKGKIVNSEGKLSNHLDIIIYDNLNYPSLFTDKNHNLILPLESVYCVIEVKSKTNSTVLNKAFKGLKSVSDLNSFHRICSRNEKVDYCPPNLFIFSFQDDRSLEAINDNFITLSERFQRNWSFSRYSQLSPGHVDDNGHHYLVSGINIVGTGSVYAMLDGNVAIGRWKENTFGMLISSLLSHLNDVVLGDYDPTLYLNWLEAGEREIYER